VTALSEALLQAAAPGMSLKFAERADQAVLAAMGADVVVLVVGEHPSRSGENANVAIWVCRPARPSWCTRLRRRRRASRWCWWCWPAALWPSPARHA